MNDEDRLSREIYLFVTEDKPLSKWAVDELNAIIDKGRKKKRKK